MLVCHCKRVCDRTVREVVQCGARSVDDVGEACRAGTGCGGCRPLIDALIDEEAGGEGAAAPLVQLRVAS